MIYSTMSLKIVLDPLQLNLRSGLLKTETDTLFPSVELLFSLPYP